MSAKNSNDISIGRLILSPALISLGITVIRLVGELQRWPSVLFKRDVGGLGSIIGIVWLAPIFGIYFAVKLCRAGAGPSSAMKDVGLAVVGLLLMAGGFFLFAGAVDLPGKKLIGLILVIGAFAAECIAWPKLFWTMIAYGYSARIPVLIVMFFAMQNSWGTHYDAVQPNAPVDFWPKFLQYAVVTQMIFWIIFTAVSGGIFGAVTAALSKGRRGVSQTA
ncbi:MAG TPA: hypothetical protein VI756_25100 [Blastocatellia bacterium]